MKTSLSSKKSTNYLKIGQAAQALGVSIDTLRRWEKAGKITAIRTPGGTRLYHLSALKKINPSVDWRIADFQAKSLTTEELLKGISENIPFSVIARNEVTWQSSPTMEDSSLVTQNDNFKRSFVTKFLIGTAFLSIITLILVSWITASYLTQPKAAQEFFKNNIASGILSPFHFLAEETVSVIDPQRAQELGFSAGHPELVSGSPPEEIPKLVRNDDLGNPNVLAVTASPKFLEVNSDTQINGSLSIRDAINGLSLEATPSAGTIALNSGTTTLTVTKDALLDQDVSTTSAPAFNTLSLSATKDQLVFQSGGPTGTLTWTPTAVRTITLPDVTTTLVGTDTTQTLTNKSLSGSSNTLTNIPNSALTNNKVTVTAGTNLTGGGDISLGSSATIALKDSPSITGTLTVAGATTLSSTVTAGGVVQLADGTAAVPALTFTNDTNSGLYRIGSDNIGLITGGTATQGITIDASGNVGIGTITPSATLDLIGTFQYTDGNQAANKILASDASGNASWTTVAGVGGITGSGASGQVAFWNGTSTQTGSNNLWWDNTNSRLGIGTTSPSQLFQVNYSSTNPFVVTSSGNVGIGTATPVSKLGVTGNVGIGVSFGTKITPINGLAVEGNVGIGTTSPQAALHVWGAGSYAATFLNGNVGIGTTAPSATLDVAGHVFPSASDTYDLGDATHRWRALYVGANEAAGTLRAYLDKDQLTFYNGTGGSQWSGGLSFSSTTLSVGTETNSTVVGTTSSNYDTTIQTGAGNLTLKAGTTGDIYIQANGDTNDYFSFTTTSNIPTLLTVGSADLALGATSEAIRIQDSTGNVGIGFTSPNALLHIGGANQTTAAYGIQMGSDITLYRSAANTLKTDNNLVVGGTITGSGTQFLAANGTAALPSYSFSNLTNAGLWTNGDGLLLTTGGTNTSGITVTGAGNVGIGTTAPSAKLHVSYTSDANDGIKISGSSTSGLHLQDLAAAAGMGDIRYNHYYNGSTTVYDNTSNFGLITRGYTTSTAAGSYWNWLISNAANSSGFTELMRITGDGKVGIGTATPGAPLAFADTLADKIQLNGNSANPYKISFDTNLAGGNALFKLTAGTSTAGEFGFYVGSTNALFINSTGNVGIGTTGPVNKFEVYGADANANYFGQVIAFDTASLAADIGGGIRFGYQYTSAGDYASGPYIRARKDNATSNNEAAGLAFGTRADNSNPAEVMRLTSSGNVGIGTTSPDYKLDVRDGDVQFWDSADMRMYLTGGTNSVSGEASINLRNELTDIDWLIGFDKANSDIFHIQREGTDALVIDSNRNVGIGTVSPVAQLDLRNTNTSTGLHMYVGSSAGQFGILDNGNVGIGTTSPQTSLYVTGNAMIGYSSGAPASLANGLAVSGNVGIGTTGPNAGLEVLKTTEQLRLSYDADSFASFTVASDSDLTIKPAETGQVIFQPTTDSTTFLQVLDQDGGTPILNIDATNERVGIGTTSPSAGLQVGSGTAGHSPASTGIYVVGQSEFDGRVYFDGRVTMADDQLFEFGGGVSLFLWETADVNANELTLMLPEGGTTDVPVLVIGDDSIYAQDLGFFNGVTEPRVAVVDDDADSHIDIGFYTDDKGMIQVAGAGTDLLLNPNGGNVGIGTTGPAALLQVGSAVSAGKGLIVTSAGYVGIGTTNPTAAGLSVDLTAAGTLLYGTLNRAYVGSIYALDVNTIGLLGGAGSGNIALRTQAENYLLVNAPNASVDILKTLDLGSNLITNIGNANTDFTANGLTLGGATPTLTIGDAGAEDTKLVFDGNAQDYYMGLDDTDDALKIGLGSAVGTTAYMTVLSDGNVGIGTTGPTDKLEIKLGTNQTIKSYVPSASGITDFVTGGAGFLFSKPDVGTYRHGFYSYDTSGGVLNNFAIIGQSDIVFATGVPGSSETEQVRIKSTGNVGIGTASPTGKLIVSGGNVGIGVSSPLTALSVNGAGTIGWGLTGVAGPSNGLAVSGNVGIGTTSPQAALHVWGAGNYAATFLNGNVGIGTTGPDRILDVLAASAPQLRLTQTDGSVFADFQVAATTGNLTIYDKNNNELLTLAPTTSAVNELTIANATTTNAPTISATGGDTNIGMNFVQKGEGRFTFGTSEVGDNYLVQIGSPAGNFVTVTDSYPGGLGVSYLTLKDQNNGRQLQGLMIDAIKFDIGSSTGSSAWGLKINNNLTKTGDGTLTNAAALYITDDPTIATNNYSIFVDAGNVRFDGETYLAVDSGNVGIGTTGPGSLLDISSTAPTFRMTDTTASAKSLLVTTDGNLTQFEEAGGAANDLLVLDLANARVGLGTTGPAARLEVQGVTTDSYAAIINSTATYPRALLVSSGQVGGGGTNYRAPLTIQTEKYGGTYGIDFNEPWSDYSGGYYTSSIYSNDANLYIKASNSLYLQGGTNSNININAQGAGDTLVDLDNDTDFNVEGGQLFAQGNSGYVGIGTAVPGAKLTVIGNVGIGTSAAGASLQVNGGGLFGWGTASVAGPANGLGISGNVGIGTTTTSHNLEVVGTSAFSSTLSLPNGSASTPALNFSNLTNAGLWTNGDGLLLTTGGTNTSGITVTGAGRVGIGTTAPAEKLDLASGRIISNWTNTGRVANNNGAIGGVVYDGNLYTAIYTAGDDVYRYDGGTTWTNVGTPLADNQPIILGVHNDKMYAGTTPTGTVYRYDGGTTWTNVGTPEAASNFKALISYNGNLYAAVDATVYLYDGGSTWTSVGNPYTPNTVFDLEIHEGKLYACSEAGRTRRYDGGTTWTNVGNLNTDYNVSDLQVYNGSLYGIDNNGTVYRYDGGTTWTSIGQVKSPTSSFIRHALAVYQGNLYAGVDDYVYRYDGNNNTWTSVGQTGNGLVVVWLVSYNGDLFALKDNSYTYKFRDWLPADNLAKGISVGDDGLLRAKGIYSGDIILGENSDIRPRADSTTAFNIANAAGTAFVTFDTTNSRVGIGTTGPGASFAVSGNGVFGFGNATSIAGPSNGLAVSGNVGIGTTSPGNTLNVVGGIRVSTLAGASATHVCRDSNNDLSACSSDAEYAPMEEGVEEGDLVVLSEEPNPIEDEHAPFLLTKSTKAYDDKVMGVVIPENLGGSGEKKADFYKAFSIYGYFKAKVSTASGEIKRGDYLTTSDIPGVAMKMTRPGRTIGMALEDFDENTPGVKECNYTPGVNAVCGKIRVFNNLSFADPGNFLASLSLDDQGNLIMPSIKIDKLTISSELKIDGKLLAKDNSIEPSLPAEYLDLSTLSATVSAELASAKSDLAQVQEQVASASAQTKNLADQILSASAELAQVKSDVDTLKLTPPDILLATGSATLASLKVTSEATISGMLLAYQAEIQDNFKSLGQTTLGQTLIAGDLTVDGTMSITGDSLSNLGILYIQNSSLAESIDLFNGKVTIDKNGNIVSQGEVTAASIVTNKLTVSNTPIASGSATLAASIGTATLPADATSVTISTQAISNTSRIFVTPTTLTDKPLSAININPGVGFNVALPSPAESDIEFNWWIVESN